MERVLILFILATAVLGVQYDGLRVKYGWSEELKDKEYFFKIPRTISDVETEGWKLTERPPGALPQLKMYCPPGRGVCALYDPSGFVAGLMIAFPVDDYVSSKINPEKKFVKWNAPASNGEPAKQYWTITQYYVPDESSTPQAKNGATLQFGGVWVAGPDGKLLRIPTTEAEIKKTPFIKQTCIPNMGTHHFYKLSPELDCEQIFPWFGLTRKGELVGSGFQLVGQLKRPQPKEWLDNFNATPTQRSLKEMAPLAPQCYEDWIKQDGLLSLHIYFVNDPWNISCEFSKQLMKIQIFETSVEVQ